MDINGSSSFIGATQGKPSGPPPPMSQEQKDVASQIIAQFDPDNFTEDDFRAMNEQLREAGIRPGKDLKVMLDESGIDVEQYLSAQPNALPSRGPSAKSGISLIEQLAQSDENVSNTLNTFLEKMAEGSLNDEDAQNLVDALRIAGQNSSGLLVSQNI